MPCENRHGNRRSHGNKNARNHCRASQERALPDSPATIEKAFGELLDERFGQARFRHSALRHWLEKCSNRNSRETAAPGNLLPACGLSHSSNSWKSGTASGKRTSITTGCPGFGIYLSGFLVAFLHAADRLGLLFVQVQNINHILPFFRNGAGTYNLN